MAIDVVFLPQGGTDYLRFWREGKGPDIQHDEWNESALHLPRRALGGDWSPTEVFLCLRGDHLVDRFDYSLVGQILNVARNHAWGSKIYVVVDRNIGISADQIDAHESLSFWFDAVLREGATDIIEVGMDRYDLDPVDAKPLRIGSDLSRLRQEALRGLVSKGQWKCFLPNTAPLLSSFVYPFVKYSSQHLTREDLVIVVDKSEAAKQTGFVRKALREFPDSKHIVAAMGVLPSRELQAACQLQNLKLFRCRGPFELRYTVLRLNAVRQQKTIKPIGSIQIVPRDAEPTFTSTPNGNGRSLLLTSSFDPHTEPEQCILAARDAGSATHEMPLSTTRCVHQAVTCKVLPYVLTSLSEVTVWLHLGHGEGASGLQEASSGVFKTPEQWLSCFSSYGGSLALAFFSSCRSNIIARRFAEAGAGVAIGFENEVPPEACRLLAAEVVRAALRSGGNRNEILSSYHAGCSELVATGYVGIGPTAFYSK